ncbi:MAG: UvrD-helicase domain-containing protein, partial [Acidobacteriota bacterium]
MSRDANDAPRGLDLLDTPIDDGITVIEASAGTGKTYCLTGLVLRLLLERRVEHVGQILVVTFTQAATEELVGRIRAALRDVQAAFAGETPVVDPFVAGLVARHGATGETGTDESADGERDGAEILRRALLDFDDLTISTLHGFCRRVLEESAFESGLPFESELVESDDVLLLDAGRDVWRRWVDNAGPVLAAVATARGWTPARFLVDYRACQQHPSTRLLPETRGLDAAGGAVHEAAEALRHAFDRSRLRLALQRLPWKGRRAVADRRQLKALLSTLDEALKAASDEALADHLWAFESLHPDALASALPTEHHAAVLAAPGIAEIGRFFDALDGLEQAVRAHMIDAVGRRFAEIKSRGATLAFDDLLHRLADALDDPRHGRRLARGVRRRFRAALIDEFQDTDLVQYGIFRRLFGAGPLLLVGDPKQAIYRFRGADIYAYLGAKREAQRIYGLERNWRTGAPLLDAVHAVFDRASRPFVFADVPFQPVEAADRTADRTLDGDGGAPLEWRWITEPSQSRATSRLHAATAAEIAEMLAAAERPDSLRLAGDGGGR